MSNLKYKKYDRFCQLGPKDDGRPPMSCLRPNDCNSTNGVIEQYERKTWQSSRPYVYTYNRNNDRECKEGFDGYGISIIGLLPAEEDFSPGMLLKEGEVCQWNNQCRSGRCDVHSGNGMCMGNPNKI